MFSQDDLDRKVLHPIKLACGGCMLIIIGLVIAMVAIVALAVLVA